MNAATDTITVKLEWYEVEQAVHVGARREAECMRQGKETPVYGKHTSIENHMESAGAEKATGKHLNLHWPAAINTFNDGVADVGGRVEVRYRRDDQDLIVREDDHDDRIYVLVWGAMPNYELVGWTWGKDGKQNEFWKNPGDHGWAWFIPPERLRPISELMVMVRQIRRGE